MIDTPEVVTTAPLHYAALPLVVPSTEIREHISAGLAEISAVLKAQSIPPSGPWFTHHHRRPTDTFDFEICFPVATPITSAGRVQAAHWASAQVVRTIYHGTYAQLPHAWGELQTWMQSNSVAGCEEFWEAYLVGPSDDPSPDHWQTQLNWPLA